MIEALNRSNFVKKYSVQFASEDGSVSQPFYFSKHFDHDAAQTWQVVRSEFDQMLLDNAANKGAQVWEQTAAKQLVSENDVVVGVETEQASGAKQSFRAPITIDCSGRDGFAMNRNQWRLRDPDLSKIALWTYYQGAIRDEGLDEGATTIAYLPDRGWFWYIPLPDQIVSVGITADRDYLYREGKDLEAIFDREVKANKWIEQHLSTGQRIKPFLVTGDYSYRSQYCANDGLVLAGDAMAFLDPVFSSGVFLALQSGVMAADAVEEALRANNVSARQFVQYSEKLCQGIEAMRKLVYAFYDKAFSFGHVLRQYPRLRGDLTDCLIGNLFRDFDQLFEAIGKFAYVPPPLKHGRPMMA